MRKHILMLLILLLVVPPVFAPDESQIPVSKKYDFSFSLSGGNIGGKFNLAGNFLYAQEFNGNFFLQTAAFVNNKEAGGSFGLGLLGKNIELYLFGESMYRQKMFFQVRPALRLRFSWLSLAASYALPVGKSTTTINGEQVSASKYWGGEVNVVPVDWARIYAEAMSVENTYTRYRVGVEVRLLKWLSLSADWNKTNSNLYSKWSGYEDLRVALNFLFGSQRQSFKLNQRIQMQPMYPILTVQKSDTPIKDRDVVEFLYKRTKPVLDKNSTDPKGFSIWNTGGGWTIKRLTYLGNDQWMGEASLIYSTTPYWINTVDGKVMGGVWGYVAETFYARVQGSSEWIQLTCIEVEKGSNEIAAKFYLDDKGIRVP